MRSQRKLSPLRLKVFSDTKMDLYFLIGRFTHFLFWLTEPEPLTKDEPKPKPSEKAKKKANNSSQVG